MHITNNASPRMDELLKMLLTRDDAIFPFMNMISRYLFCHKNCPETCKTLYLKKMNKCTVNNHLCNSTSLNHSVNCNQHKIMRTKKIEDHFDSSL